jgi:hypothetical protein
MRGELLKLLLKISIEALQNIYCGQKCRQKVDIHRF